MYLKKTSNSDFQPNVVLNFVEKSSFIKFMDLVTFHLFFSDFFPFC